MCNLQNLGRLICKVGLRISYRVYLRYWYVFHLAYVTKFFLSQSVRQIQILHSCEFILCIFFSFPFVKDGFDEESFKQHKDALIAEKLEKDPSLTSEADVYWYQIVDKRYVYCSLMWCF